MKLIVPYLNTVSSKNAIEELSLKANSLVKNEIAITPWPSYDYKPKVCFAICHGTDCLLLKYFVVEQNIRAVSSRPNDPVYKDTCVEFFIALEDDKEYYNFEFNCIGTTLVGFGKNRENRILLPDSIINNIVTQSVITRPNSVDGSTRWQLTLMIPLGVFYFHTLTSLKDLHCRVNFYKCGDELPQPHYLVWNNIRSDYPDFHLSEFFEAAKFDGVKSL